MIPLAMVNTSFIAPLLLCITSAGLAQTTRPASMPDNPIDRVLSSYWTTLGITPTAPCSDAVFLRRAYLDIIGTLPTEAEARVFLLDARPAKRAILIDELMRREEFAIRWSCKWGDLLRIKAEFPINLWPNAAAAFSRWVRTAVRENMPYDQFARELLTGSGSNFRSPPANFYRAVQGRDAQSLARAVALTFMGARADRWPKDRLDGLAGFFSQVGYKSTGEWKEEIVFWDQTRPALPAVFPDGAAAKLTGEKDPRAVFADWLTDSKGANPYFARAIVNRQWYWLLGRGIVHEPDDFRADNPPSHPELLDLLARELVEHRFDLRHTFRLILTSQAYQRDSGGLTGKQREQTAAQFACYPLRQLDAEMLIDAICQITGVPEQYYSPIPEPFTVIPRSERALSLADGSIGSTFLEMFGRPARDTGMELERNNAPTAAQRLHLLNSTHVQRKIEQGPGLAELLRRRARPRELIDAVYLTVLSRRATDREAQTVLASAKSPGRETVIDLVWALINSSEFLYRH